MIDCMILGDSIAVGIGQARPECVAYVKQGIDSYTWNNRNIYKNLSAGTVIISLGSNDGPQVNTFQEILALRQFVSAAKVFWILPANKPAVQDIIKIVARNYKDISLRGSNYYYSDNASELADLLATFDSHSIEIYDAYVNEDDLDEQNVTGAVAGFNTPAAFAKPGKWKSKSVKYERVNEDKVPVSKTAKPGQYQTVEFDEEVQNDKFAFSLDDNIWWNKDMEYPSKDITKTPGTSHKKDHDQPIRKKVDEMLDDKYEQLIEGYRDFANGDSKKSPEQKVKATIQEIAKKLHEIETLVNYNSRLKNESGVTSSVYGPGTTKALSKISQRLIKISERIRSLGE
jgi:hypothetical protein